MSNNYALGISLRRTTLHSQGLEHGHVGPIGGALLGETTTTL